MQEIFSTLLQASASGTAFCLMETGKLLMEKYVSEFVSAYSRGGDEFGYGRYDPAIVGNLLQGLITLAKAAEIKVLNKYPS